MYLTKEEELELGRKIQLMMTSEDDFSSPIYKEGRAAVDTLVENYTNIVNKMAWEYKKKTATTTDIEDIIQDGMIGLMNAVYKYDPSRNNKFSTHAVWWIKQSINRSGNTFNRIVRLPENRIIEYYNSLKIERLLRGTGKSKKEVDDIICEELEITQEKLEEIRKASTNIYSLNTPIEDSTELGDLLKGEDNEDAVIIKEMLLERLIDKVEALPEIARDAIKTYFDLTEEFSYKEVLKKYNISRTTYYKHLNSGLEKIKEQLKAEDLTFDDFL